MTLKNLLMSVVVAGSALMGLKEAKSEVKLAAPFVQHMVNSIHVVDNYETDYNSFLPYTAWKYKILKDNTREEVYTRERDFNNDGKLSDVEIACAFVEDFDNWRMGQRIENDGVKPTDLLESLLNYGPTVQNQRIRSSLWAKKRTSQNSFDDHVEVIQNSEWTITETDRTALAAIAQSDLYGYDDAGTILAYAITNHDVPQAMRDQGLNDVLSGYNFVSPATAKKFGYSSLDLKAFEMLLTSPHFTSEQRSRVIEKLESLREDHRAFVGIQDRLILTSNRALCEYPLDRTSDEVAKLIQFSFDTFLQPTATTDGEPIDGVYFEQALARFQDRNDISERLDGNARAAFEVVSKTLFPSFGFLTNVGMVVRTSVGHFSELGDKLAKGLVSTSESHLETICELDNSVAARVLLMMFRPHMPYDKKIQLFPTDAAKLAEHCTMANGLYRLGSLFPDVKRVLKEAKSKDKRMWKKLDSLETGNVSEMQMRAFKNLKDGDSTERAIYNKLMENPNIAIDIYTGGDSYLLRESQKMLDEFRKGK